MCIYIHVHSLNTVHKLKPRVRSLHGSLQVADELVKELAENERSATSEV